MALEPNVELAALYAADQQDRRGDIDWTLDEPRDRERRRRVEELIEEGALATGEDYFHAAMVFQHGGSYRHFWRAHQLAKTATDLGCERARGRAAAAYDRWLMKQGKPQKYGIQFQGYEGRWQLWKVDPDTTDDERAEWNVPPLATTIERLDHMNAERPPPA
jgi:hypothetical protein